MRPLIISEQEKFNIKSLISYASQNVIDHKMMMKIANKVKPPIGDDPNFSIKIPHDYRVVYTHEMHKGNIARHISISVVSDDDKYPSIGAIELILKEFGFTKKKSEQFMYFEKEVCAINIIELIN